MRSFTAVGEKAIGSNGFLLFGALTLIMAILKLTVITDWSWWRVSLPIAIFVGFNMAYILVGFIYLSLVNIREKPPEDETALVEGHHRIPHTWISLLFFALFADNLVRWWEGAEDRLGNLHHRVSRTTKTGVRDFCDMSTPLAGPERSQ